jgi:hypothetical protein
MDKPLINRVANSNLITLNLEDFIPKDEFHEFDIADYLFQGLILREKDFRLALKDFDWESLKGKNLLIFCSADAIIPIWAYMLVVGYAEPMAQNIFQGTKFEYYKQYLHQVIEDIDGNKYNGERVIIKGCSEIDIPVSAYVDLTNKLRPFAQSIMFGEACSNVPIFKRPRELKK